MRLKTTVLGLLIAGLTLSCFAGDGIPVGDAVFFPSIEAVYTSTDNLFMADSSMPTGNESDEYWEVRPTLGIEIPFNESLIRMDLGYQYKDYNDFDLNEHNSYFFDFNGLFKFSNGVKVTFKNHFIRGSQEVLEFDPGYEKTFGNSPFVREDTKVAIDMPVNAKNNVGVYAFYNYVHFTGDAYDERPFYDYHQTGGGLTWDYALSPTSSWLVDAQYEEGSPDHNVQDALLFTQMQRDYDMYTLMTGWKGSHKDILTGMFKLGYGDMSFSDNNYSEFSGLVGDVDIGFQPAQLFKVDFTASRHPYQSTFNVNNYFTATTGQLQVQQEITRYFFWTAGYRYQENNYPDGVENNIYYNGHLVNQYMLSLGRERKDRIYRTYGELGFHFTKQLSLRLNYRYEKRDSNIDYLDGYGILRKPFSYDENRFSIQGMLAW